MSYRIGLFLSGGGALGSWQAGFIAAVYERYRPDFSLVAGFSVGSLNGISCALGRAGELEKMWTSVTAPGVMTVRPSLFPFSLYSIAPLRGLLTSFLGSSLTGYDGTCPFVSVAFATETARPHYTRYEKGLSPELPLMDALLASCAIPYVFPPVRTQDNGRRLTLVDGGVRGPVPIDFSLFEGMDAVLCVDLSLPPFRDGAAYSLRDEFERRARASMGMVMEEGLATLRKLQSPPRLIRVTPRKPLPLRILEFNTEKCSRAFREGREQGFETDLTSLFPSRL